MDVDYVIGAYRGSAVNLRSRLLTIMTRAGVTPWLRLWQNMRASRETELVESFPDHVVSTWVGHSVAIARKHYLQVTDAHFAMAAGILATCEAWTGADPKAVRNPVLYLYGPGCTESQPGKVNRASRAQSDDMQPAAVRCGPSKRCEMTPRGFEPRFPG